MKALSTVFTKAFILPFYRVHAGLLLFVFFVMFGTVEPNQLLHYHRSLIEATFITPLFRSGVFILWALYSLKTLHFILTLLRQPHYTIIHQAALLSKTRIFGWMIFISILCSLPVLAYSFFICQFGIQNGYYMTTFSVLAFQIMLCALNGAMLLIFISTRHIFSWSVLSRIRIPALRGRPGIYLQHILHHEKLAIGISKVFSIGLLYSVKAVLATGDDFRIIGIAWLFALLGHAFIVLKIKSFEDRYLLWVKSLPLTTAKSWLFYTLLYALLMLPEWILVSGAINHGITLPYYLMLPIFSGVWLTFIHAYLLKPNREVDQFTTWLFIFFIVSFASVLFKLTILFIAALALLSFFLFHRRYYAYEPPNL